MVIKVNELVKKEWKESIINMINKVEAIAEVHEWINFKKAV